VGGFLITHEAACADTFQSLLPLEFQKEGFSNLDEAKERGLSLKMRKDRDNKTRLCRRRELVFGNQHPARRKGTQECRALGSKSIVV